MLYFDEYLNESEDIKNVYLSTRKIKSVTNSNFVFYLIKDFMDVGYWDRVSKSNFKKAYDKVIKFLLKPNSNTERLAKTY